MCRERERERERDGGEGEFEIKETNVDSLFFFHIENSLVI